MSDEGSSGPPTMSEADLAQRIARGDPAAERELVERFGPALHTMIRRRVKDPGLAEDLSQEALRIAIASLREGQLRDTGKLSAYLWGIASHLASRDHRRRQREHVADVGDREDPAPSPDRLLLASERARRLRQAVDRLVARDRRLLTALYFHEASKEQICRQLGLTPAQFDVVKCRALKRLAAAWRADEDDRE